LLLALGLLTLGAVVGFALLGRAGDPLRPEAALAQASERTLDLGSFRVAMTYKVGTAAGRGEGAVDVNERRGSVTWKRDVTDDGGPAEVEGVASATEAIFVDDRLFLRLTALLPTGKSWLEMPLAAGVAEAVADFAPPFGSPDEALELLEAASSDVARVGVERVRGVETERFRGTIDLERAAAGALGARRAELQAEVDSRREAGVLTTIPVEVWIGEDGVARRIRLEESWSEDTGAVTVEYFDFGTKVTAEAPSKDQTISFEEYGAWLDQSGICDVSDAGDTGYGSICIWSVGETKASD
jgi:hypothetical protein